MNHKKWREKFWNKDSRRFLKRHEPYYSKPCRPELMPPVHSWIHIARSIVRNYPEVQKAYNEMHRDRLYGRSVERDIFRELPRGMQADLEAVEKTIAETKLLPTGERRLALIRMMYWDKSHSMDTARRTKEINASLAMANQWDFLFLRAVAWNVGMHYNHRGRNRFGHSRKTNGLYR